MTLRALFASALLAAGCLALVPQDAHASPFTAPTARTSIHAGPHIFVRGGLRLPIGRTGGYWREVVETTGGYYQTRTEQVQVPGQQIGWDLHGNPLYGPPHLEVRTYQVWVPRRQFVRRVWVPARAIGHITIGGRVRLR
jgi:hypothetical protein